jgi:hypothetical protein
MSEMIIFDHGQKIEAATMGRIGVAKYTGSYKVDEKGNLHLLTSGELMLSRNTVIDAFLVGGGGAGGYRYHKFAGGGGGGYTNTVTRIQLEKGKKYTITIGNGGTGGKGSGDEYRGEDGEETKAFGKKAAGGLGGGPDYGGDGGSGGGGVTSGSASKDTGGTDGSDGNGTNAGKGQGTTTKAFGEKNEAVFSDGGRGGMLAAIADAKANTGNGGAGSHYIDIMSGISYRSGRSGGSGIVIIRETVM